MGPDLSDGQMDKKSRPEEICLVLVLNELVICKSHWSQGLFNTEYKQKPYAVKTHSTRR